MPKSELETIMATSDYNIRKFMLNLLEYKKQIKIELGKEDIPVEKETSLKEALVIIEENISKIRFEGIL
ncbi:MAG: hypothetical protein AABY07_03150 [Nanoarchaeota archaeon]